MKLRRLGDEKQGGKVKQAHIDGGLAERSYPIHIGSGLLKQPELLRAHLPHKRGCYCY